MASVTIDVTTQYTSSKNTYTLKVNGASPKWASTATVYNLDPGDRVTLRWSSHSGSQEPPNIEFFGFEGDIYEESSSKHNVRLTAPGQSAVRTIKNSPSTTTDTIRIWDTQDPEKYQRGYFKIKANNTVDVVPDSFSMGSNKTNQARDSYVLASPFTISGLDSGVSATVYPNYSGHFEWSLNDGQSWTSFSQSNISSVSNGSRVLIRCLTSGNYNNTSTLTLSIGQTGSGTQTDSWSVTTQSAQSGAVVPFGITSGNIKLAGDIKAFFGGNGSLRSYARGGGLVPNITQNNNIGTSTQSINMTGFYGSAVIFEFNVEPTGKTGATATNASGTLSITWSLNGEFGFSYGINDVVELRYTFTQTVNNGNAAYITSQSGNPETFSQNNDWGRLNLNYTYGTQHEVSGELTIHARLRNRANQIYDLSRTVPFSLIAFNSLD